MESNGEPLEKVLYFDGAFFPPSPSILTRDHFEKFGGVLVPPAKGLDDEWLEEDALSAAVVEMIPDLGGFSHLDGRRGSIGGAMKDDFLDGRNVL